jgi:hypothetical protein
MTENDSTAPSIQKAPRSALEGIGPMLTRGNIARSCLWTGCALLAFSCMAISVRELLRHVGAFEILLLR